MLFDQHQRQSTYLRLAVTDRCNLRCRYCMPAEGIDFSPRGELLTFEEIVFLGEVLAELGVVKVRLTGGEPLVRRDLPGLVERLGELFPRLAMTTNGVLLPPVLDELIGYGLTHYNLSLDTLRADRFRDITRRDDFAGTRMALTELLDRPGAVTKINVVTMRGVNDDEITDFVALTREHPLEVRFIEAMPFNDDDGNHDVHLPYGEIKASIERSFPELQPADGERNSSSLSFKVPDFAGTVGIIPAYSRSLCGSCNRLRLTPKGTLLNCLYSTRGLELRPLLRAGIGRADLAALLVDFVAGKHKDGHETQRLEQADRTTFASMTSIGG